MRVDIESDCDRGVAEPFTDHLGMDASLECEGGVGVAEIMESDPRQPDTLQVPVELPADIFRVEGAAVLAVKTRSSGDQAGCGVRKLGREP